MKNLKQSTIIINPQRCDYRPSVVLTPNKGRRWPWTLYWRGNPDIIAEIEKRKKNDPDWFAWNLKTMIKKCKGRRCSPKIWT